MKAIELKVDAYIKKPIVKDDLLNSVFKSAACLSKRKDSELRLDFAQSVLSTQMEFSLVCRMDTLQLSNNLLFNMFGFSSLDEFFVYNERLKETLTDSTPESEQSGYTVRWIQKMLRQSEQQIEVFFKIHGEKALKPYILNFRQTGNYILVGGRRPPA